MTALERLPDNEPEVFSPSAPVLNSPAAYWTPDDQEIKVAGLAKTGDRKLKGVKTHLIHETAPIYPPIEREHLRQGIVEAACTIDRKGDIREPYILISAGSLFNAAAIEAVRQWKFSPPVMNDLPVDMQTVLSVSFRMKN